MSNRINFYNQINNDINHTITILDTSTALTAANIKFVSETIERVEILLPTYKNLDRNGIMLSSGAIKRLNQDLNNNYLIYLDNFKFSYDLSNKMTTSLNESINRDLYPNVDLNFTDPLKNHVEFNFETFKNNRSFFNSLQKSIWYRSTVLTTLEPLLVEAKSLIEQIDKVLK